MPPDRSRPHVDDAESSAESTAARRASSSSPAPTSSADTTQGRVRAALAAVRNLETLLRSPRVGTKVLRELQPELPGTFAELRAAFAEHAHSDGDEALREFVSVRAKEVEEALAALPARELDARGRLALERLVTRVSADLDAAGELLDMVTRARADKRTDLAMGALGRASLQLASGLRPQREARIRIDVADLDAVVSADARVVAHVLAIAAALARDANPDSQGELVLRARCGADSSTFAVEPATKDDAAREVAIARTTTLIGPSLALVREVAIAMGGAFELEAGRATLTLQRVTR